MSDNATTVPAPGAPAEYQVGTLTYTRRQLFIVIFWLLFGAALMMLQSTVFNVAMPYLLKDYGFADSEIIAALSTMQMIMGMVMCPILSFRSDRCRSGLGRRRPFILYTAVPLGLSMAMLPYWGKAAAFLETALPWLTRLLPEGMPLLVPMAFIGVALYFFFFLFVGTLYYCFIPDVVPHVMIGRFYGIFRGVGAASALFFNFFMMEASVDQPEFIFPVTGLAYVVVAVLMCLIVKEGGYPPPENNAPAPWYRRFCNALRSYVVDCFSKPYYLLFYSISVAFAISLCLGSFENFFFQEGCGMSKEQIGIANGIISLVQMLCCLAGGWVADRLGGIRTSLIGKFGLGVGLIAGGFIMHDFYSVLIVKCICVVFLALQLVAGGKIGVEVFPRSKYGQFGSAQTLLSSLLVIGLNYPIGLFANFVRNTQMAVEAGEIAAPWYMPMLGNYRFINFHSGIFMLLAFLLLFLFSRIHRHRTTRAVDL